jgi:uncharacterized membrane protein YdjX (TVP38/TMEM64 family)
VFYVFQDFLHRRNLKYALTSICKTINIHLKNRPTSDLLCNCPFMMHAFVRGMIWFSLALLVPIIPFVLLGESFEEKLLDWIRGDRSEAGIACGLFGLLTIDLFLPVPSTAVSTYAGGVLPWGVAFFSAFGGLSCGHLLGFGLSRTFGRPFAKRWGEEADLERLDQLSRKYGPLILVVTRALPLLSEASVFLLGLSGMRWLPAALAILLSNAVIAAVYVSVGAWFQDSSALVWAVIASALLPLLPLWWVRKRLSRQEESASV